MNLMSNSIKNSVMHSVRDLVWFDIRSKSRDSIRYSTKCVNMWVPRRIWNLMVNNIISSVSATARNNTTTKKQKNLVIKELIK